MIVNNNNKERTWRIVELAIPAEYKVKLKESEKRAKYQDLAWEMKKYGTWKWREYQLKLVR